MYFYLTLYRAVARLQSFLFLVYKIRICSQIFLRSSPSRLQKKVLPRETEITFFKEKFTMKKLFLAFFMVDAKWVFVLARYNYSITIWNNFRSKPISEFFKVEVLL